MSAMMCIERVIKWGESRRLLASRPPSANLSCTNLERMEPVNSRMSPRMPKIVTVSIVCGVVLTVGLTATACVISEAWVCTLVWQACLVQTVIHTPDNPNHEGSPIDLSRSHLGYC
jgi:hypothetical protein